MLSRCHKSYFSRHQKQSTLNQVSSSVSWNSDDDDYDDEEDPDGDPVLAYGLVPQVDPGHVSRRVQEVLSCSFETVADIGDDLILREKIIIRHF